MAIVSVGALSSGQSGSRKWEKSARHYTQSAIVVSNNRTDDANQVIDAVLTSYGLTLGSSIYGGDTLSCLTELTATMKDVTKSGTTWTVNLIYDTDVGLETEADPLDDEIIYSGSFEKYNRAIMEDLSGDPDLPSPAGDGKAILNSCFEPFESCPEQEMARLKITMVKNYDWVTFDITEFSDLINTVNSATWNGYAPYRCKCDGISFKREKRNNVRFYQVTFDIVIDEERPFHPIRVLNCGFKEFVEDDVYRTILDSRGQPLTKPSLLDADGFKLEPGDDPVYLEFQFYYLDDWSSMPVPD